MFEKIRAMVAEQLEIEEDKIKIDTDLVGELECDSLEIFQLFSDIEDEYDVNLDDVENLKSIGDLIKVIEESK